ncbi:hypothetical protein Tco_0417000 [Tanacetum coccineum]
MISHEQRDHMEMELSNDEIKNRFGNVYRQSPGSPDGFTVLVFSDTIWHLVDSDVCKAGSLKKHNDSVRVDILDAVSKVWDLGINGENGFNVVFHSSKWPIIINGSPTDELQFRVVDAGMFPMVTMLVGLDKSFAVLYVSERVAIGGGGSIMSTTEIIETVILRQILDSQYTYCATLYSVDLHSTQRQSVLMCLKSILEIIVGYVWVVGHSGVERLLSDSLQLYYAGVYLIFGVGGGYLRGGDICWWVVGLDVVGVRGVRGWWRCEWGFGGWMCGGEGRVCLSIWGSWGGSDGEVESDGVRIRFSRDVVSAVVDKVSSIVGRSWQWVGQLIGLGCILWGWNDIAE